jgi:hypothetical protein
MEIFFIKVVHAQSDKNGIEGLSLLNPGAAFPKKSFLSLKGVDNHVVI